jgi:glycosyltransferase involved in cell wall biosynthesis
VVEALAARRAAKAEGGATVYSSVTAALLQPPRTPMAVRFDGTAALNRPGPGGAWQRRRERSVMAGATLLLPWSQVAADSAAAVTAPVSPPSVLLPPPVPEAAAPDPGAPDVVAYGANPDKRGIDLLYAAWREAGPEGARLGIAGLSRDDALRRTGLREPAGVEWLGALPRDRWMANVAGARLFVSASRFEDWGLAQMEALSAGTPLVTVPSGGGNVALPLARTLAPGLVAPERTASALADAIRAGLALDPAQRSSYADHAQRLLVPYREDALRRRVAEEVLPRLLNSSS